MSDRLVRAIATRAREVRESRGFTLQQAASALGTSVSRVRAWEIGSTRMDGEHMERLADVYGVDPFSMFPVQDVRSRAPEPQLSPRESMLLDAVRRKSLHELLSIVATLAADWGSGKG